MNCVHFREQYSDFADGLLDEADEIALLCHMAECEACKRMDGAYRAGSNALKALPDLDVSEGFHDRLQARILMDSTRAERAARTWRRWPSGALILVAVMSVAGWQFADHALPSGRVLTPDFVVHFVGDSSLAYPGRVPMIPVSRDSARPRTTSQASFQIAVDYMIVP